VVAALAIGAFATPSAQAKAAKPTVMLVHGACADSSSWDGVIALLQASGYTSVAFANPLAVSSAPRWSQCRSRCPAAPPGPVSTSIQPSTAACSPARRAHAHVTEIPAPHASMLTFAGAIAKVIETAAR
jgi:pimeloyl-ACP methyl ester carboxylesterase